MKSYTAKVTYTLTVYVGVEGMDEADARENAMSAVEDMSYDEMECEDFTVDVQKNGEENDLPEGWCLDEYDASEILTMI